MGIRKYTKIEYKKISKVKQALQKEDHQNRKLMIENSKPKKMGKNSNKNE